MTKQWKVSDMPNLSGKNVIVTGANSGVGYEAARAFAEKGAHVVFACRSRERAEEAVAELSKQNPKVSVEIAILDLADMASVHNFAQQYNASHERLDILVNNAGVMAIPYRETADGFEMQLGTNHLGHFALTGLLLDRLASRLNGKYRLLVPLLSIIWLAGFLPSTLYYSRQVDFVGIPDQIEQMAESFPPNSILLFNQKADISIGDFLAVPLFFAHGHNGFVLTNLDQIDKGHLADTLVKWHEGGYEIYWIAEDNGHSWPLDKQAITFRDMQVFSTRQLESVPDRQPTEILPIVWQVEVHQINPQFLR